MKKPALLVAVLLGAAASATSAAPAVYFVVDHSTSSLIDVAVAKTVIRDGLPAEKLKKLYPVGRWGFVSEVEGGFDDAKTCIITARAMLLPRATTGALVFKPEKTATTFGTRANATNVQCKALAQAKLAEATEALRFGLTGR